MSKEKLAGFDNASLIAELRSRGNAVCVFGAADIAQCLVGSKEVAALWEEEIDTLAQSVMRTSGKQLEEGLSQHGRGMLNDVIRRDVSYQQGVLEAQARVALAADLLGDLAHQSFSEIEEFEDKAASGVPGSMSDSEIPRP